VISSGIGISSLWLMIGELSRKSVSYPGATSGAVKTGISALAACHPSQPGFPAEGATDTAVASAFSRKMPRITRTALPRPAHCHRVRRLVNQKFRFQYSPGWQSNPDAR